MLAGRPYDPGDGELVALRRVAQGLMRDYNATIIGDKTRARLHQPLCRVHVRRVQRAGQQLLPRDLRRERFACGKRIRSGCDSAENQNVRRVLLRLR